MRLIGLLLAAVAVASTLGCGPVRPGEGGTPVSPVALANVLPAPAGLETAPLARPADVAEVQRELAGRSDAEGVRRLEAADLQEGAIRRWSGPDGARVTAVITRWSSRILATNVGAAAAERLLDEPGARAWTPSSVPGSRGARVGGASPRLTLSRSVGPNGIFFHAEGPVTETAVARLMELAVTAAEGGLDGG